MKKYAYEIVIILMFTAVMVLQLHLIKTEKQRPKTDLEAQITKLNQRLDSLKIEENYYEEKIFNNRIIYNTYRDSILSIPDTALKAQVYAILDRYSYLHAEAIPNDTTHGK